MSDKYGRAAEPEKRRPPPLSVALTVALRQLVELMRRLGMIPADVPDEVVKLELDHIPALILRDVDPVTRHHIPHQHDPDYLEWKFEPAHAIKSHGRGATTAGSDVGEAKKLRNLVAARRERELKDVEPAVQRQKPKRQWSSRPFPKGRRFSKKEKRR